MNHTVCIKTIDHSERLIETKIVELKIREKLFI